MAFLKFQNGEQYYNKIYLLFNFYIALSLAPFGYLLLLRQSKTLIPIFDSGIYLWCVTGSLIICSILIGVFSWKKFGQSLLNVNQDDFLRNKLIYYFHVSRVKYLAFLLIGWLCVVGLFLTSQGIFIILYIFAVVLLSLKRPTLHALIADLQLSDKDRKILIEKTIIE